MVHKAKAKHKAVGKSKTCPICGRRHSRSEHLSHGKGSFNSFPSRRSSTKQNRKLTKAQFLRRMNKGRKAKGLKLIRAKK